METKIVYVVTSSEKDSYLEQTLMSVYSLRLHNPNEVVWLVTDKETENTLVGQRSLIRSYVDRVVSFEKPDGYSNKDMSRYLKTSLRNLIEGDFLFIDSDTVVCGPLAQIENFEGDICAVPDSHVPLKLYRSKNKILKRSALINWNVDEEQLYINSGVFFVRDTKFAQEFYRRWHEEWNESRKKGLVVDQASLNKVNMEFGYPIKELPGQWNCQVCENGIVFLHNAVIIHYFASGADLGVESAFLLHNKTYAQLIKESGSIGEEIKQILANPYAAFTTRNMLVTGSTIDFYQTQVYWLYTHHPKIFMFFEKLLNLIRRNK